MSDIITNTTSTNYGKFFNVYVSKSTTAGTALVTRGSLNKTDPTPTVVGLYILEETGIYPNLGNIDAQAGKLNFASFDGTTWSKVEVELIKDLDFEIDLSDVEISEISNGINIKINSDILFFQKFSSKYFRLKAGSYDLENGNYIRLMAGSNELSATTPSGSDLTLGGIDYTSGGSTKSVLGIVWNNKLISKYYQKEEAKDFYFSYKNGKTFALQENGGIKIYVTESVLFFEKNSSRFFKVAVGVYEFSNGDYIYVDIKKSTADNTELPLLKTHYSTNENKSVLGIVWGGKIISEYDWLKNVICSEVDLSVINPNDYLSKDLLKNQIRSFYEAIENATETQPIEITAIGDSIMNFQGDELKTDRTVEPQGLYGNTFLRQIWSKLNGYNGDVLAFSGTNENQWGNMRFLRVDNSNVVKSGEFIPHGTRESDNARIYWSKREYITAGSTALGGYREPIDGESKSTSIGNVKLHNHVYFFADYNSEVTFSLAHSAKGFSVVFWGDLPSVPFPKLPTDANQYLSDNVGVYVDNVKVGTIDLTTFKGQSRVDFPLTYAGAPFSVKIKNEASGKVMNLWGVEYWVGKCVRMKNLACAGNSERTFYDNPDFFIEKPTDLYIWEATVLNNPISNGNEAEQIEEHRKVGAILKSKNKAILPTNVHPIVEGIGGNTNFPNVSGHFQHLDNEAANKAFFKLQLFYIDTFSAFKKIAIPLGYTNFYNNFFTDGTHLSAKGGDLYARLFNYLL